MDWSAKLFGLDEKFYTSSGVGGGVIQVWDIKHPTIRRSDHVLDNGI